MWTPVRLLLTQSAGCWGSLYSSQWQTGWDSRAGCCGVVRIHLMAEETHWSWIWWGGQRVRVSWGEFRCHWALILADPPCESVWVSYLSLFLSLLVWQLHSYAFSLCCGPLRLSRSQFTLSTFIFSSTQRVGISLWYFKSPLRARPRDAAKSAAVNCAGTGPSRVMPPHAGHLGQKWSELNLFVVPHVPGRSRPSSFIEGVEGWKVCVFISLEEKGALCPVLLLALLIPGNMVTGSSAESGTKTYPISRWGD